MEKSRGTFAILATIAILTATGCTDGKKTENTIVTIDLFGNAKHADTDNASDVMEIQWILHPETTDSTLLENCNIAGTGDNSLYIRNGNNLLVYNPENGSCLSSFNRTGQGPEEYIAPWTAWKTPSMSEWTVYDQRTKRIINYSDEGKYIREFANDSISDLIPDGNGWISINEWIDNNEDDGIATEEIILNKYDADFNFIGKVHTGIDHYTTENGNVHFPIDITCYDGRPYFRDNDTIYAVKDNKFEPLIALNTGSARKPRAKTMKEEGELRDKCLYIFRAVANDNHILVGYKCYGNYIYQIYRLSDGQLLYSKTLDADADNPLGFTVSINGIATGALVCPIADDSFYLFVTDIAMADASGDDDANPAFIKIHIKD